MVSTDGRTDRRTDTEGYNIIPRHTLVAGYKKSADSNESAINYPAGKQLMVISSALKDRTRGPEGPEALT